MTMMTFQRVRSTLLSQQQPVPLVLLQVEPFGARFFCCRLFGRHSGKQRFANESIGDTVLGVDGALHYYYYYYYYAAVYYTNDLAFLQIIKRHGDVERSDSS